MDGSHRTTAPQRFCRFVAALGVVTGLVLGLAISSWAETEPRGPASELGLWRMFLDAGPTAKAVMILLVLTSIWSVSVMIEKSRTFSRVGKSARDFLAAFRKATSLEALSPQLPPEAGGPMVAMFRAGMNEYQLSFESGLAARPELRERMTARIRDAMDIARREAMRELGRSMSLLATVGSTAPFVGLFGTVWGIMTSFVAISSTQTTNLAVVAPGIAEALLATAIGLATAIPAVIAYNRFARRIGLIAEGLQLFQGEFALVLARQLDKLEGSR